MDKASLKPVSSSQSLTHPPIEEFFGTYNASLKKKPESQLKILEVRLDNEALCVKYAASRATVQENQQMLELASSLE